MENITFGLAFFAGIMAFISPCCLPLYPTFISYITGITVSELKDTQSKFLRKQILFHSVFFSIGFSLIYYVLGFSASSIGTIFIEYRDLIRMHRWCPSTLSHSGDALTHNTHDYYLLDSLSFLPIKFPTSASAAIAYAHR